MKIEVKTLPTFATQAAKIVASRGNEPFTSLTVKEAEMALKTWLYESILEVQEPEEASLLYYTRTSAAKELGIAPITLDEWVKSGLIKYKWLGNRRIFLHADLAAAIRDEKFTKQ
ncbi:MAG: hypothetical protein V2B15_04655 [Bacteroidota bacterium]